MSLDLLIDHSQCGGGGCRGCKNTGVKLVRRLRPVGLVLPADAQAFEQARETCPCYRGFRVNAGAQCTHADHRSGGEWCDLDVCPAVAQEHPPQAGGTTP